jgi:hypothetical protein
MSYLATQSRAAAALARKGQSVTIAGASSATYDPATSATTPVAYNATAMGVVLPLNPFKLQMDSVKQGDETLLLPGTIAEPPLGAIVTLAGGNEYTLIAVDPLHPDGTELLFDCVIRGNDG